MRSAARSALLPLLGVSESYRDMVAVSPLERPKPAGGEAGFPDLIIQDWLGFLMKAGK